MSIRPIRFNRLAANADVVLNRPELSARFVVSPHACQQRFMQRLDEPVADRQFAHQIDRLSHRAAIVQDFFDVRPLCR